MRLRNYIPQGVFLADQEMMCVVFFFFKYFFPVEFLSFSSCVKLAMWLFLYFSLIDHWIWWELPHFWFSQLFSRINRCARQTKSQEDQRLSDNLDYKGLRMRRILMLKKCYWLAQMHMLYICMKWYFYNMIEFLEIHAHYWWDKVVLAWFISIFTY